MSILRFFNTQGTCHSALLLIPQGINVQCKVDLGTVKRYQLKILPRLHSIVKIDLIDYLILCNYYPLTELLISYQIVRPSPDSSSLAGFLVPS